MVGYTTYDGLKAIACGNWIREFNGVPVQDSVTGTLRTGRPYSSRIALPYICNMLQRCEVDNHIPSLRWHNPSWKGSLQEIAPGRYLAWRRLKIPKGKEQGKGQG